MTFKLWIIGVEGMLGQAVLNTCVQRGIAVTGTAKRDVDITSMAAVEDKARSISFTHIVNCAAYTDVDGAEKEYEKACNVNAQGAQNVAVVARSLGARLMHISTDYIFDGTHPDAYREESEANPINAYGRSKWEGEKRVLSAFPQACIVRTSWLFGRGGNNFFSSLISWLKSKKEISAVSDQWGRPTYATDLACALLNLKEQSGIFHFANREATSRFEIAQFALELMRAKNIPVSCQNVFPVSKEMFPAAASRPSRSILSTEKYALFTGEQPRPWKEALQEFVHDIEKK